MANVTLKSKLILRNDTEENWRKKNPVLLKGEVGLCTDKQYLKFGNGTNTWNDLPDFNKRSVILSNQQPDNDNVEDFDIGAIWFNTLSLAPELYMMTYSEAGGKSWGMILTERSLDQLGIMQENNFAKTSGAGAETGYVDKALKADKLTIARTVSLTGGVVGSTIFDGSSNLSIAAKLAITENDVPVLPLTKIRDAGTAASRNVGTTAGQVPILDSSGKLNTSVLPQLAVVDVVEAASDQEMTAKNVQKGDICLRSDAPAGAFILAGDDPHNLANWKRIPVPANAVLSVNGKVGVVTLTTDDVAEGVNNRYFTASRATAYLQDATNTFILEGGNA